MSQLLILNSGVPVIGTSDPKSDKSPENKAKREAATAEALAKAKAMVEAEQKKSAKSDKSEAEAEKEEPADKGDVATGQKAKVDKSEEVDGVESKKRTREDDDEAGPEMKKVDSKAEPVQTNRHNEGSLWRKIEWDSKISEDRRPAAFGVTSFRDMSASKICTSSAQNSGNVRFISSWRTNGLTTACSTSPNFPGSRRDCRPDMKDWA